MLNTLLTETVFETSFTSGMSSYDTRRDVYHLDVNLPDVYLPEPTRPYQMCTGCVPTLRMKRR